MEKSFEGIGQSDGISFRT